MAADTQRPIKFSRGVLFLLLVLGLATIEAIGSRVVNYAWDVGSRIPVVESNPFAAIVSLGVLVAAWIIMNREGVTATDIGLGAGLLVPASVTVAGYFLALNAVGAGLAVTTGHPGTIGYQWTVPPAAAIFVFLWMLVIAGLVEEFLFRGYIQTKCIAMLGGDRWSRIALGIVGAGVLFSVSHVPRVLLDGAPSGLGPSGYFALLTVNGIAFGLLYEWTQNLYLPVLVHAAGNMPGTAGILFFSTAAWPNWANITYQLVYLGVTIGMIVFYRRWAMDTGWFPVWTDRTAMSSSSIGVRLT